MPNFVHLHVHSHYSLLTGLAKIKPLVKAAKARGFSALALTDYGSLYGAIEFYKTCLAEDIKPIIGFEAFIAPRRMQDTDPEKDKGAYHLVLLAENYDGYRNLMRLSSIAHLEGFFDGRPRLDKDTLAKYAGGIIALSGPIQGEVPSLLKSGDTHAAQSAVREYSSIFGANNFYLELNDHPAIDGQMAVNTALAELSKNTGIPCVVTRDVHYLNTEDAQAQDILVCVRDGRKVEETGREDMRHVDRSLNTAGDILSRFRHIPDALSNTAAIADRVHLEIELDRWHFAPVALPAGKTADTALAELVADNVSNFYNPVSDEVKDRIAYELGIISDKGYAPYFLCVADYVKYAKDHGIIETTRGSAAGSVVSFVIGITTVDPIRFKLPFERFLNPYRPSPPDIDTDFADDRREEMIDYVTAKYGGDKVAQIITFGTMAARASVRDVGRALGFSYGFCDQVAKLIPFGAQGFPMTIERALKEEPDLRKLYTSNEDVKRLLDLARKVEGCVRHTSIHAAGVVISPTPLTDFTPVQREVGGEKITTQYEMKSVEAAGVLKMDFLGIRNLSILGRAVEIVEKTTGEKIDVYALPLDDQATFEMLSRGETMGTFQLGGAGMTRWLKELKPTRIDDIIAMVALFRPGPMDVIPEYIKRHHNPSLVSYLDDRMRKYLDMSYGLLVYQEDVLLTAIELAGYDWLEADKFRKAMGKKIPQEMEKQKIKFFQGCRDSGGLSEDKIRTLWQLIEPFAAYGFGKAHAASYGIVAYQTSYMKAHYPVQYMTAVLQAESGDTDKVAAIVHECSRIGIEVMPPDINESFRNFAMVSKEDEKGRIRFGLSAIKNVGEHICEVIYRERKESGSYSDLENFLSRVQDKDLNKKSLESLIQAGALDCFGIDRGVLLGSTEQMLSFAREMRARETTGQNSLFSGTEVSVESKVALKQAAEATLAEKLVWEKTLLGLYVSSHPFASFESELDGCILPISQVEESPRDSWVTVGGVIDALKKKITKRGEVMMFVTIQDRTGSVELLVFPRTYEATHSVWQEGSVVCIVGKTPRDEGDNKIFVERAYPLSKDSVQEVKAHLQMGKKTESAKGGEKYITLTLTAEKLKEVGPRFKELFENFPGDYRVFVKVGSSIIRGQTAVEWSPELNMKVSELIGEQNIAVSTAYKL